MCFCCNIFWASFSPGMIPFSATVLLYNLHSLLLVCAVFSLFLIHSDITAGSLSVITYHIFSRIILAVKSGQSAHSSLFLDQHSSLQCLFSGSWWNLFKTPSALILMAMDNFTNLKQNVVKWSTQVSVLIKYMCWSERRVYLQHPWGYVHLYSDEGKGVPGNPRESPGLVVGENTCSLYSLYSQETETLTLPNPTLWPLSITLLQLGPRDIYTRRYREMSAKHWGTQGNTKEKEPD